MMVSKINKDQRFKKNLLNLIWWCMEFPRGRGEQKSIWIAQYLYDFYDGPMRENFPDSMDKFAFGYSSFVNDGSSNTDEHSIDCDIYCIKDSIGRPKTFRISICRDGTFWTYFNEEIEPERMEKKSV